jgi:hypothetical protein
MNACVILFRVNGGPVMAVMECTPENEYRILEYPNLDAAITYADANKLFRSGQADYQIVELDEL